MVLRGQFEQDQIPELLAKKQSFDGTNVLVSQVDGVDAKQLRDIVDQLKERLGSGVVVLASAGDGNVSLVASVSPDLTRRWLGRRRLPVDAAAFAEGVADWLDPHGLWSAAPDAPVGPSPRKLGRSKRTLSRGGTSRISPSRTILPASFPLY